MSTRNLVVGSIIFCLVLLIGAYFVFSTGDQNNEKFISYSPTDKERPILKVNSSLADLGTIKVSDEKVAEFTIKNIGSKALELSNMLSSCSCTTGQLEYQGKTSKEYGMHSPSGLLASVLPNSEAKIKVIYRPYVMPVYGEVEREVYLTTNDPNQTKLVFQVKTVVK